MNQPNVAMLDGDIIAYKAAFISESEGKIPDLEELITTKWVPPNVTSYSLAFSCDRKDNFRREFWPHYKTNRDGVVKPDNLNEIKEMLINKYITIRIDNLEADDIIGIHCSAGSCVSVSIDKDFKQIPGWFWIPGQENAPGFRSIEDANLYFYKQWIIGDDTDNVWGLWKKGEKFANKFLESPDRVNVEEEILNLYKDEDWDRRPEHKKPTVDKVSFAVSQARCIRVLRENEYVNASPVLWSPSV